MATSQHLAKVLAIPPGLARDRLMVLTPDAWGTWPMLPLWRRGASLAANDAAAYLMDEADQSKPTIYLGLIIQKPDSLPTRQFDSIDAMLAEYRID